MALDVGSWDAVDQIDFVSDGAPIVWFAPYYYTPANIYAVPATHPHFQLVSGAKVKVLRRFIREAEVSEGLLIRGWNGLRGFIRDLLDYGKYYPVFAFCTANCRNLDNSRCFIIKIHSELSPFLNDLCRRLFLPSFP